MDLNTGYISPVKRILVIFTIHKTESKSCGQSNLFQQALLDMFYMDNIFEVTKHSIVLYFLQDIIDFTAAQHVTQVKFIFYTKQLVNHYFSNIFTTVVL